MTPQNIEFQIPNQDQHGPDSLAPYASIDKRLNKATTPEVADNPLPNEVLYMRQLGNRISGLRDHAVQVQAERDAKRHSPTDLVVGGFDRLLGRHTRPTQSANTLRTTLMDREDSMVGSKVFKHDIAQNATRHFFYDDAYQHQAWVFVEAKPRIDGGFDYEKDMRYDIDDDGVLEVARVEDSQNPQGYRYAWQYIGSEEYNKLRLASDLYYQQIVEKIYQPDYGITE